jgi:hypothetical protein
MRKTKSELEFEAIERAIIARKRMGFAAQFHVDELGRDYLRREETEQRRQAADRGRRRQLADALNDLASLFGGEP